MATQCIPQQQKALMITAISERMTVGERHVPQPGAGQVLVRNIAVAINPVNMWVQKTGMFLKPENLPVVCGNDGAGEICAIGQGVQGWNIEDKVFYQAVNFGDRASFQEYTLVDATLMARVPLNITVEQAATISLGLATAAIGIYRPREDALRPSGHDRGGAGITPPWAPDGLNKYSGQAALVIGGASSVGQFALQLLRASGFSPLITTASSQNEAYCKAAGATHVIDYKVTSYEQLPDAIKSIVRDVPVSLVYDAVAKGTQAAGFSVLAPNGGMVIVFTPQVGTRGKDDDQGRRVVWVYGATYEEEHKAFGVEMYANLTGMLERGELKPNKVRLLEGGLAAIPAGCDEIEKGVSGAKLVVRIRE